MALRELKEGNCQKCNEPTRAERMSSEEFFFDYMNVLLCRPCYQVLSQIFEQLEKAATDDYIGKVAKLNQTS